MIIIFGLVILVAAVAGVAGHRASAQRCAAAPDPGSP
jgi:hypothetical protein